MLFSYTILRHFVCVNFPSFLILSIFYPGNAAGLERILFLKQIRRRSPESATWTLGSPSVTRPPRRGAQSRSYCSGSPQLLPRYSRYHRSIVGIPPSCFDSVTGSIRSGREEQIPVQTGTIRRHQDQHRCHGENNRTCSARLREDLRILDCSGSRTS